MSCREFLRRLEEARDGGAAPSSLDDHAAACPRCARLLLAEREAAQGLRSLRETLSGVEPPLGFVPRVVRRAQERTAPAPRWTLIAGVALAAGLVGAALLGLTPRHPARAPLVTHAMPAGPAEATPVVWSDGAVDIVGPSDPSSSDRVERLVEWNL